MARSLNLREYQENILARLQAVADTGGRESGSRLGVMVAGQRVLVNLQAISEVLPPPAIYTTPLAASWFLGMANIRGNLYAVNDIAQMLGKRKSALTSNSRVLLIADSLVGNTAILVDHLVGIRNIDDMTLVKQLNTSDFCYRKDGYKDSEMQDWRQLDVHAFIHSEVFIKPAAIN